MTVTQNEHGQHNMFAKEPPVVVQENYVPHNVRAEMLNGRVAMISIMIGLVSYISTGKLFFFTW
jgi:hypothetical protein